jgi:hypothetical protein
LKILTFGTSVTLMWGIGSRSIRGVKVRKLKMCRVLWLKHLKAVKAKQNPQVIARGAGL